MLRIYVHSVLNNSGLLDQAVAVAGRWSRSDALVRDGFDLLQDNCIAVPDCLPAETPLLTCIQIHRQWLGETTPADHQASKGLEEGSNSSLRK
jgi:hypothetical protein